MLPVIVCQNGWNVEAEKSHSISLRMIISYRSGRCGAVDRAHTSDTEVGGCEFEPLRCHLETHTLSIYYIYRNTYNIHILFIQKHKQYPYILYQWVYSCAVWYNDWKPVDCLCGLMNDWRNERSLTITLSPFISEMTSPLDSGECPAIKSLQTRLVWPAWQTGANL